MTPAQNALIKAAILADPVLAAQPADGNGLGTIADALNAVASPVFTVWKTNVSINTVGDNFSGTELAGMTSANQTRLQTIALYSTAGVNPSLADRRAFFDDVFSGAGGTVTRAKLLALWKRPALRIEKILATGTGSDAVPATLGYEGTISPNEVDTARRS